MLNFSLLVSSCCNLDKKNDLNRVTLQILGPGVNYDCNHNQLQSITLFPVIIIVIVIMKFSSL